MGVDTREIGEAEVRQNLVAAPDSGALRQITEGEISSQVATAKRFPRSLAAFKNRLLEMVRLNKAVAGSAFYVLPRDGKRISGPSVRMAEMAVSAYGNCRVGGRIIDTGEKDVTVEGVAMDLENNTAWYVQTKRRLTNRDGKRYPDDLVIVTTNAAISIAVRNAALRMIPRALIDEALDVAKQVAAGDIKDLATSRKAALAECLKLKLDPGRVFAFLEVEGEEDITVNHLLDLKGALNAIADGEATVTDTFPLVDPDKAGRRTFGKQAIKPQAPTGNGNGKEQAQTEEKQPPPVTPPVEAPPATVTDPTHAEDTAHTSDRKPATEPLDPKREPKVDRNDFWNEADKALKGNHVRAISAVQKAIDDLKALKKLPAEVAGWQDVSEAQAKMVLDALKKV
jgi:hypothetical protein